MGVLLCGECGEGVAIDGGKCFNCLGRQEQEYLIDQDISVVIDGLHKLANLYPDEGMLRVIVEALEPQDKLVRPSMEVVLWKLWSHKLTLETILKVFDSVLYKKWYEGGRWKHLLRWAASAWDDVTVVAHLGSPETKNFHLVHSFGYHPDRYDLSYTPELAFPVPAPLWLDVFVDNLDMVDDGVLRTYLESVDRAELENLHQYYIDLMAAVGDGRKYEYGSLVPIIIEGDDRQIFVVGYNKLLGYIAAVKDGVWPQERSS